MFKQKYDTKSKKWINDSDENFNNIEFDDGYKSFAFKKGE